MLSYWVSASSTLYFEAKKIVRTKKSENSTQTQCLQCARTRIPGFLLLFEPLTLSYSVTFHCVSGIVVYESPVYSDRHRPLARKSSSAHAKTAGGPNKCQFTRLLTTKDKGVVLKIKVPGDLASSSWLKQMSTNHDMRPFSLLLNDSFTAFDDKQPTKKQTST
jgi:hypothetical protein